MQWWLQVKTMNFKHNYYLAYFRKYFPPLNSFPQPSETIIQVSLLIIVGNSLQNLPIWNFYILHLQLLRTLLAEIRYILGGDIISEGSFIVHFSSFFSRYFFNFYSIVSIFFNTSLFEAEQCIDFGRRRFVDTQMESKVILLTPSEGRKLVILQHNSR